MSTQSREGAAVTRPTPAAVIAALKRAQEHGSIKISNLELREWPLELFDPALVMDKDKWWEAHPAVKLDVSGNQLPDLPDEISGLQDLVTILAQHNVINYVSLGVSQLQCLQTLDLSQ